MPDATMNLVRQSIFAVIVAASAPALATSQRTFVSGQGSDGAACSITAPCRSFTAAIAQTIAGGEVIVLDSAGYGPVTITQSVTITAPPGVYAGISVPAATPNGVLVIAPGTVVLRGLTINSTGGTVAINLSYAAGLTIERCRISGFTTGILQSGALMNVRDTVISDGSEIGVRVDNGSATLDGVSIERMGIGVRANGYLTMRSSTISDVHDGILALPGAQVALDAVTITNVVSVGVYAVGDLGTTVPVHVIRSQIVGFPCDSAARATGAAASSSSIHVTDSLIANCANGVYSSGTGLVIVSGNTIVNNGIGLNSTNDNIYSMQNNQVFGNTTSSSGFIGKVPYQ